MTAETSEDTVIRKIDYIEKSQISYLSIELEVSYEVLF